MSNRQPDIEAFAETVRRYCAFIETGSSLPLGERISRVHMLFAELVLTASRLPAVGADSPEVGESPQRPSWPDFGPYEYYSEVFDPYEEGKLVTGSLTDDVIDVYCDLKMGLDAFDAGHVEGAVWDWRFNFAHHWGHHAVDGLRALQRACVDVGE